MGRVRSLHHIGTLGASLSLWAERNLPCVCTCICCSVFLGLEEEKPFLHQLPILAKSSAVVGCRCERKCCSFCERYGSHEPNQGSRHVGHPSSRVPLNAKYPCPVLWGNPPPPLYAPSIMSGGRKSLPKMAFCCLPRCLPGKSGHLSFAAWLKPTGMDGHSHKTPHTSCVRGAIPTAVALFRRVGLLFVKRTSADAL